MILFGERVQQYYTPVQMSGNNREITLIGEGEFFSLGFGSFCCYACFLSVSPAWCWQFWSFPLEMYRVNFHKPSSPFICTWYTWNDETLNPFSEGDTVWSAEPLGWEAWVWTWGQLRVFLAACSLCATCLCLWCSETLVSALRWIFWLWSKLILEGFFFFFFFTSESVLWSVTSLPAGD